MQSARKSTKGKGPCKELSTLAMQRRNAKAIAKKEKKAQKRTNVSPTGIGYEPCSTLAPGVGIMRIYNKRSDTRGDARGSWAEYRVKTTVGKALMWISDTEAKWANLELVMRYEDNEERKAAELTKTRNLHWLMCCEERCGKWRSVSKATEAKYRGDNVYWSCSMGKNKRTNACYKPQEKVAFSANLLAQHPDRDPKTGMCQMVPGPLSTVSELEPDDVEDPPESYSEDEEIGILSSTHPIASPTLLIAAVSSTEASQAAVADPTEATATVVAAAEDAAQVATVATLTAASDGAEALLGMALLAAPVAMAMGTPPDWFKAGAALDHLVATLVPGGMPQTPILDRVVMVEKMIRLPEPRAFDYPVSLVERIFLLTCVVAFLETERHTIGTKSGSLESRLLVVEKFLGVAPPADGGVFSIRVNNCMNAYKRLRQT